MTNPSMPNIPGMEAVADTLEFVKNLWGSMGIPGMGAAGMPGAMPGMNMPGMNMPGMVMPTLSVEEINKKIADLKAVESWLNLNMGMLRSTIQALEVQSATISTLQSMGQTFAASMSGGLKEGGESKPASGNGSAGAGNGHAAGKEASAAQPAGAETGDAAMFAAPLVNAAAWWNALQEQFANAVTTAMADGAKAMAPAAPATEEEKPAARPKRAGATANSRRKSGKPGGES
ncbi:PhaM family polyhydroxyalkanoate granule multifunctional regulatory protein [Noviherbaspirillum aridicola]|uniref:Transcriptional regulator n=1 Tax=Noviherbaspirillum aridicola TaxID=2849687 RepID=A0ABQ4Q250_9BURK|nr:PhaM family polyhydroxyalkanoate granule multifunctional regulatory protein [Noviherbaspirillum aridicola]GIZ50824.1 hypothetical protein NCCP691_08380 [Noviherbaspirillum aridicola]